MAFQTDDHTVRILAGPVTLEGNLDIPAGTEGIVLFAHGSGSGRHSPRNRYVAEVLRRASLATLLLDLLTSDEEQIDMQTGHLRFDIPMLAGRLGGATDWIAHQPDTHHLRIGYFGASTGSAAALLAAAERPNTVKAVVSRGGRPDLAGAALSHVKAPTLLLVGGLDVDVIDLNRTAMASLTADKKLQMIPGATHLFEEPGTLEEVARLASDWFEHYLSTRKSR